MRTNHATERALERCSDAGIDPRRVTHAADAIAAKCNADTAVRLVTLAAQVNVAWSDRSNGDEVWAIVRQRRVITIMLRRSTQPKTAAALKVERVIVV